MCLKYVDGNAFSDRRLDSIQEADLLGVNLLLVLFHLRVAHSVFA